MATIVISNRPDTGQIVLSSTPFEVQELEVWGSGSLSLYADGGEIRYDHASDDGDDNTAVVEYFIIPDGLGRSIAMDKRRPKIKIAIWSSVPDLEVHWDRRDG